MKLYGLSEEDVASIIQYQDPNLNFQAGKHEIVSNKKFSEHGYPLKVVFSCENGKVVIITAYPLKRGLRR